MQTSDPTFPLFPILSFLGFALSVIPLPWHFQAWNSGTCAFMLWVGCFCLILFIDSLIWADNAINSIPVWCDITSQIIAGAGVGIPASTLCISRRLYRLTSTRTVSITRDDKRRAIYEDVAIAVGLPILVLLLHMIVQGHRFDIIEEYGCSPTTYNTLPAYFLYYMWPVLIGLVSFVYSSLTLRTFYIRRLQFTQIVSANSTISPSRYLRLMLLALIDIMCTIPVGIYIIFIGLDGVPLAPWISWNDTHFDFNRVVLIPSAVWRSNTSNYTAVQINRWLPIVCAFIFFALFGFAEEAMKNYRRAFWFFAMPLGFRPSSEGRSKNGKGSMLAGYVFSFLFVPLHI
ncbi:pheromone receptor [Lentinula edodes]|uniref:pheromone receptor n=1 Tax=Lentinula edodes TaxID=5353 RepID=UPI001E8CE9D5|nr:pheromone receptor [Lentinula edodes]KAH7869342.1 pheromone receptor [Lentinula edodes]